MRDRQEMKDFKDSMKMGGNLIVSMITAFIVVFWLVKISMGDLIYAMIAGSIGAIFMMMVETLLYIIRLSKVDAKLSKFRKDEQLGKISPFGGSPPPLKIKNE